MPKFTVVVDDDVLFEHIELLLIEADRADPLGGPLSIVFSGNEPELYFGPSWQIEYEARLPLRVALERELESFSDDEGEADKITILKRLLAVLS
jgi:hypothetical protein